MVIFQVMGFNPADVGLQARHICMYVASGVNICKKQKEDYILHPYRHEE